MEFASSRSLMTTYRWCWCSCCFCAFSCCCCRCCTPRYSMTTYRLNNLQLVWKLRCIFVCMQIVFCERLDLVSGDHRFYGDSSKQDPMPRQILMNLIRNFKSDNCPMTQCPIPGEQDVLPPAVYEMPSVRGAADIEIHHLQRSSHL